MRLLLLFFACVLLFGSLTGCKTRNSGSREFIPGKGWVPTR